MSGMNSDSCITSWTTPDWELVEQDSFFRVFNQKGIFVVPYRQDGSILAALQMDFQCESTKNESLNMYTNPEIGFYGYFHVRTYKECIGSAFPINQRTQFLFSWHPHEQYAQVELAADIRNLGLALDQIPVDSRVYFPTPWFTDFSFGFQREGRYTIRMYLWYWKSAALTERGINDPVQYLPDPEYVKNQDPGPFNKPIDTEVPYSLPYGNINDYGESDDLDLQSEPGPVTPGNYRIFWSTKWTNLQTNQEETRSSYADTPLKADLVNSISGPVADTENRQIYHIVNYVNDIENVVTFNGSLILLEWQEQIEKYEYNFLRIS